MGISTILRRMGLPGWTFFGVAVAATVVFYGGKALENLIGLLIQGISPDAKSIVVSLLLIASACLPVLCAWLWQKSRLVHNPRIFEGEKPQPKRGLILLISRADSAMHAIEYHLAGKPSLESVWLVPSNGRDEERFGTATMNVAEEIKTRCKALAKKRNASIRVEIHETGVSPGDAQDTFDYVNRIFRRGSYQASEIIADFTGGTKPMTVGMVMACLARDRQLEYVPFNQTTGEMYGPYLIDYEHSAFDLID
jgi:hypothetical protein